MSGLWRLRALIIIATVALVLATATGASGSTWRFASGEISIRERVQIGLRELTFGSCALTMRGTVTTEAFSTRTETPRIGSITEATVSECTGSGGTPRFLVERGRPWSLTSRGRFAGSLPTPGPFYVWIEGFEFLLENFFGLGSRCLYSGRAEGSFAVSLVRETLWEYTSRISFYDETWETIRSLSGACEPVRISMPSSSTVPNVRLRGVIASPEPIEFGRNEAATILERAITLTGGSSGSTVRRISMQSGNYFAITDPNRCTGRTLSGGSTCSFTALYVPVGLHQYQEDTIVVETSEGTLGYVVRGNDTITR